MTIAEAIGGRRERSILKRFVLALFAFVGLIVPGALVFALLATPTARRENGHSSAFERSLITRAATLR